MARISMWLRSASNIPRNEGDSDEDDECDEGDTPPVVRPTSDENDPGRHECGDGRQPEYLR